MRKLCSSDNPVIAGHIRSVLAEHAIDSLVRNDFLAGAAGEIPPNECWPEIWIIDDRQYDLALSLVDAILQPPEDGDPWLCASCEETIEGQFSACWHCGAERPDAPAPS